MVVGLLGVLKAGGAYVPLDPALPARAAGLHAGGRRRRLLLTQEHLPRRLPAPRRGLGLDGRSRRARAARRPGVGAGPDDLAYVIYTSGSTGPAEGGDEHATAASSTACSGCRRPTGSTPQDRVLQKTRSASTSRSGSSSGRCVAGARLVLAKPAAIATRLPGAADREQADHDARTSCRRCCGSSWRRRGVELLLLVRVICSGEALPAELAAALLRAAPGRRRCYNLYGPTEAAIDVTAGGAAVMAADARADRPPGRQHRASTSSTATCGRCRSACRASLPRRRRARPRVPRTAGAHRGAVRPRPVRPRRERGCTAPETWRAVCRTASIEYLGRTTTR